MTVRDSNKLIKLIHLEPMEWETAELSHPGSHSAVNLEMNTKVVNWKDYSQQTAEAACALAASTLEEKRSDIKEEISDSIFTNVFFSTATKTTSSLTHQRPVTITYSRPRKNILTVSDKLFGKADKHKSKVQQPAPVEADVPGDEEIRELSKQLVEQIVQCNGRASEEERTVQCNGKVTAEERSKDELKKNVTNCGDNGKVR